VYVGQCLPDEGWARWARPDRLMRIGIDGAHAIHAPLLFQEPLSRDSAATLFESIANACRTPGRELIQAPTWAACDAEQAALSRRPFGQDAEHGLVQVITHQMYRDAIWVAGERREDRITRPYSRSASTFDGCRHSASARLRAIDRSVGGDTMPPRAFAPALGHRRRLAPVAIVHPAMARIPDTAAQRCAAASLRMRLFRGRRLPTSSADHPR
jgi:hypothetical protein